MSFASDDTLFAGTESGLYRSTNGGRAWREVAFPPDRAPVLSLALSPAFDADGVLFAGTESAGLFRSDDRGKTWMQAGQRLVDATINGIILSPQFPSKSTILTVLPNRLLLSEDCGQTWISLKTDAGSACHFTSAAAPSGLEAGSPLLVGTLSQNVLVSEVALDEDDVTRRHGR